MSFFVKKKRFVLEVSYIDTSLHVHISLWYITQMCFLSVLSGYSCISQCTYNRLGLLQSPFFSPKRPLYLYLIWKPCFEEKNPERYWQYSELKIFELKSPLTKRLTCLNALVCSHLFFMVVFVWNFFSFSWHFALEYNLFNKLSG